jgi:hypothetical protein
MVTYPSGAWEVCFLRYDFYPYWCDFFLEFSLWAFLACLLRFVYLILSNTGAPISALTIADGVEFFDDGRGVRPRIAPAHIKFETPVFASFLQSKEQWALEECYINPGPVQFAGSTLNLRAKTVALCKSNYLGELNTLWELIEDVRKRCR